MISGETCQKCGTRGTNTTLCPVCHPQRNYELENILKVYGRSNIEVFLPGLDVYIPAAELDEQVKKTPVPEVKEPLMDRIWILIQNVIATFLTYIRFSISEIKKRKFGYLIGVCSCLMVVFSILIAQSALAQVPIIFLRLAETANGEVDLTLTPVGLTNSTTFNYTAIMQNVRNLTDYNKYQYLSIRMEFGDVMVYKADTCFNKTVPLPLETKWIYNGNTTCGKEDLYCAKYYCQKPSTTSFISFDTEKEAFMGYGRRWNYPKLKRGEVYVGDELARSANVTKGDYMYLLINGERLIGQLRDSSILPETASSYNFASYVLVKVADTFSNSIGKTSGSGTNLIFMEYEYFNSIYAEHFHPSLIESKRNVLSKLDPYHYGYRVVYNLPDRINAYNLPDYDNLQRLLVGFSSRVSYALGFNQIGQNYPILIYMRSTRFFRLFLSLIINIIATILSILCIILIYSLLLINVENRVFEFAVLRMMGMTRFSIVMIILVQSFMYAIPAWVIGLVLGQLVYIGVAFILGDYFQIELSKQVTGDSVGLATGLGILIPIVASILPIASALGQNLQDSLDTSRSKVKAIKYSIERSSDAGINWTVVIIGIFFTAFGFGVYYAFPLSLLSFNITLLLYMFFALLLAMLLGLVMLSLNVETILEHYITYLLFFWENIGIKKLITKNLIAHRLRNRKTTIMFAVSLGFIMFISIAFKTQIESVEFDSLQSAGARFRLFADGQLNNKETQAKLDAIVKQFPIVSGIGYISAPIGWAIKLTSNPTIMNLGKFKSGSLNVYAVSPNFFKIADQRFISVLTSRNSALTLSEQIYSVEGTKRLPIGDLFRTLLNIWDFNTTFRLQVSRDVGGLYPNVTNYLYKPLAYLATLPWFTVSIYPDATSQDTFVSFPTYLRMAQGNIKNIGDVPIIRGLIDVSTSASDSEVRKLKDAIFKALDGTGIRLGDVYQDLEGLKIATTAMDFFLIFTTIIAMTICSFSLISSMYTNVNEQTKEIGILRAIGARRIFVWRLYIYEAFVLLIAASILGLLIGLIVGYTMTLQQILFTQYKLTFWFPWDLLLIVVGLSMVFAFISAAIPIIQLTFLPIVTILKRLVT